MTTSLLYIIRLHRPKQVSAVQVCLRIFHQEGEYTKEMRRAVMEKVCLPLLRLCELDTITEVFEKHIREIVQILENKLQKVRLVERIFARINQLRMWFWINLHLRCIQVRQSNLVAVLRTSIQKKLLHLSGVISVLLQCVIGQSSSLWLLLFTQLIMGTSYGWGIVQ